MSTWRSTSARLRGGGRQLTTATPCAFSASTESLGDELAGAIRKAVGFRNVLVHEYVAVDDAVVIGRLADLSDLEKFIEETAAYVTSAPGADR